MVVNKPTLADYWDKLSPCLDLKQLLHIMQVLMSVHFVRLWSILIYTVPPTFDYLCTVKLSQKAYANFRVIN